MRVIVVVVVLATAAVRVLRRRLRQRRIEQTEDLRFRVPVGQDPAALVAQLRVSGFPATSRRSAGHEEVVITCDPARERERVRQVIATTALNMENDGGPSEPVEFVDEQALDRA